MKQAKLPLYIRFGEIPKDKKSRVHRGDAILREEGGLSVFRAVSNGMGMYYPLLPEDANDDCVTDYFNYLLRDDRKVFLVTGTELCIQGADREPLLMDDVQVVEEITHYYRAYNKKSKEQMRLDILEELMDSGVINEDKVREYAVRTRFKPEPTTQTIEEMTTKMVKNGIDELKYENIFAPTKLLEYYDVNWDLIQSVVNRNKKQVITLIGNHLVAEEIMNMLAVVINTHFNHTALFTRYNYNVIKEVYEKAQPGEMLSNMLNNGVPQTTLDAIDACLEKYMIEVDKRNIDIADVVIIFNVADREGESYNYMTDPSYIYAMNKNDKEIILFRKVEDERSNN